MAKKKVCILGANGQLGSYLTELYLERGDEVYGLLRRSSILNTERLKNVYKDPHEESNLKFHYGDLADNGSIVNFINDIKPDICINTAAMSHVKVSFEIPEYTADITGIGVLRCLEVIKKFSPKTKFLQMSSSEMWGNMPPPQDEQTPLMSCSPYASAKIFAYHTVINYREAYNLFASNAIACNMESPRRGETFFTRKVILGACRCKYGIQKKLYLGNLNSRRDFQHCKDAAKAIMMILDFDKPEDFVIANGESISMQEFVELVFSKLDLDWKEFVEIDPNYFRKTEVNHLCGDSAKIRSTLGWKPEYTFEKLVDEMIQSDLIKVRGEIEISKRNIL